MRTLLFAPLVAVALISSAQAEVPKASIRGPLSVSAEGTIVLDARASVADRPLRWKLDGPDVPFLTLDQDGRRGVVAIVPSAPAGIYRFTLIARGIPEGETELDADAAIHVVTVDPPAPPAPSPSPVPPTPGPGPSPVSGTLHVSLILDLEAITPAQARLRESPRAREVFATMETVYRTYARSSPDVVRLHLSDPADRSGLPAIVIQDQSGKILWSGPAPSTEDELIARVKTLRGGA